MMLVGGAMSFYGSRAWGGISEPLVIVFTFVIIIASALYVSSNDIGTKKMCAGIGIGLWLGALSTNRFWWGIAGVAILAVALHIGIKLDTAEISKSND